MTSIATGCLLLLGACICVGLYRMARGPNMLDRLLAFDVTAVLTAIAVAVYAIAEDSWTYLEISMGLAVLGLVGTVAVAHLIARERVF